MLVNTPVPLRFATLVQQFPGSGQLLLTGSGNSGIRVTALSATNATLELDLDGNATFEASATLKWTDLSGPVGADLGDADTDGMHNSWETFYGLNPGDSADASADNDLADGNNLIEYQNGTNPNVAGM